VPAATAVPNSIGTGTLIDSCQRLCAPRGMPRAARIVPGGMLFHVLNRGMGRREFFSEECNNPPPGTCDVGSCTAGRSVTGMLLSAWPVAYPKGWCKLAGEPHTQAELEATGRCVARGQPCAGEPWIRRTAEQLGLESTLRAARQPRKGERRSIGIWRHGYADADRDRNASLCTCAWSPHRR
jgi:hypothetical protein